MNEQVERTAERTRDEVQHMSKDEYEQLQEAIHASFRSMT